MTLFCRGDLRPDLVGKNLVCVLGCSTGLRERGGSYERKDGQISRGGLIYS